MLVEKHSIRFRSPKCVICTAETILPAQKDYLAKIFGAPVAEEYGATEFDVVAFECRAGHRHFVNPWLLIKESEDSLLITDVSRRSTSIVNYELGDSGTIENGACRQLGDSAYLRELAGRSINRFVYIDRETKFHSVDLSYAINEFQSNEGEIFSFQIVQNEYGVLDIYTSEKIRAGSEVFKTYMERYVKSKTGNEVVVHVLSKGNTSRPSSKSYFIQNIDAPTGNVNSQ